MQFSVLRPARRRPLGWYNRVVVFRPKPGVIRIALHAWFQEDHRTGQEPAIPDPTEPFTSRNLRTDQGTMDNIGCQAMILREPLTCCHPGRVVFQSSYCNSKRSQNNGAKTTSTFQNWSLSPLRLTNCFQQLVGISSKTEVSPSLPKAHNQVAGWNATGKPTQLPQAVPQAHIADDAFYRILDLHWNRSDLHSFRVSGDRHASPWSIDETKVMHSFGPVCEKNIAEEIFDIGGQPAHRRPCSTVFLTWPNSIGFNP